MDEVLTIRPQARSRIPGSAPWASSPSGFASLIATVAPSRANRRAVAAPIPLAAPVTSAILSRSFTRASA